MIGAATTAGGIAGCRARGVPINPARRALLDVLRAQPQALDAPSLYQAVQAAGTRISLGTVYRFLASLARAGMVEAVPTPGRTPARLHARWRWIAPADDPPRDTSDCRRIAAALLDEPRGALPEAARGCGATHAPPAPDWVAAIF